MEREYGTVETNSRGEVVRVVREPYDGGMVYKHMGEGLFAGDICYVPENSDEGYTFLELVEIAGGIHEAYILFDILAGQDPFVLLDDLISSGEWNVITTPPQHVTVDLLLREMESTLNDINRDIDILINSASKQKPLDD